MKDLIKSVEGKLEQISCDLRGGISDKVYKDMFITIPHSKELIINGKVISELDCTGFNDARNIILCCKQSRSLKLSEITNIQSLLKIANAIKDL